MMRYDIVIVGGGAAGFFTAINIAQRNPNRTIAILERGKEVLEKVRISGGGRCNVTHAQFIPSELVKNYPRGERELKGPFHTFMTGDTMQWFEDRGVALKIEDDGRIFPLSDSSQTIIDCFLTESKRLGITILKGHVVKQVDHESEQWSLQTNRGSFMASTLVMATGSNVKIWKLLSHLGHKIIDPVPSLFTFNIKDDRIKNLPGLATQVSIEVKDSKLKSEGPLLITHWGMSGPAILKLSAWGAIELNAMKYEFQIIVNWLYDYGTEEALAILKNEKITNAKQVLHKNSPFDIPKRLWQSLVKEVEISEQKKWADVTHKELMRLVTELTRSVFNVKGKSTFKEEFVTAGGIDLKEVNFKTLESKKHKSLYFVGEILNIDAITGGFNFQNAWTTSYIAAQSILTK